MDSRFIFGWEPLPIQGRPLISMGIAAYKRVDPLLCLIYSLRSQTYSNWELLIHHDGPSSEIKEAVERVNDPRIRYMESEVRSGGWHAYRQKLIDLSKGDYICMSNDDNYYCPTFFEWMIHTHQRDSADLVTCNMIHSHFKWIDFRVLPRKHGCDLGSWTGTKELVKGTPWTDLESEGDGTYIDTITQKAKKIAHVPGYVFVHN